MKMFKKMLKFFLEPEHILALFLRCYYEKKFKKGLKIGLFSRINGVSFGKNVYILDNVILSNTTIGDYSYVNSNTSIKNTTIGKFCSVGSKTIIGLAQHPTGMVSIHPIFYANNKGFKTFSDSMYFDEKGERINVGCDVWIGREVTVMSGLNIGHGAIIASNAVVTKNVPPYAIVGGVPAKIIRYRFEPDIILQLLNIQWWNFDEDLLKNNYKKFHDIQEFISFFSPK